MDAERLAEEERLVAELSLLGIRYLSRSASYQADGVRPPEVLLADLVRQPSARVRAAVIALLLSHPEYADAVPAALDRSAPLDRLTLESLYVAALLLQREYAERLQRFMTSGWRWLPDPGELALAPGLPKGGTPRERLAALGREHRLRTRTAVDWAGTYEQVAARLLRQWESESRWSQ